MVRLTFRGRPVFPSEDVYATSQGDGDSTPEGHADVPPSPVRRHDAPAALTELRQRQRTTANALGHQHAIEAVPTHDISSDSEEDVNERDEHRAPQRAPQSTSASSDDDDIDTSDMSSASGDEDSDSPVFDRVVAGNVESCVTFTGFTMQELDYLYGEAEASIQVRLMRLASAKELTSATCSSFHRLGVQREDALPKSLAKTHSLLCYAGYTVTTLGNTWRRRWKLKMLLCAKQCSLCASWCRAVLRNALLRCSGTR